MLQGQDETGVGTALGKVDPVEVGGHGGDRPEQPQHLIADVGADVTEQTAVGSASSVVGSSASNREWTPRIHPGTLLG